MTVGDKPTQRPWKQDSRHIWSPDGAANVATVSEPRPDGDSTVGYYELQIGSPNFHEAIANAELIVRAVNAYDDLIEAIEKLVGLICPECNGAKHECSIPCVTAKTGHEPDCFIGNTLAKAKGE